MNKSKEALIQSVERGYHVNAEGDVVCPSGKKRKTDLDKSGYPRFRVKYMDKIVNVYVHRVVAYMKYGNKIFEPGIQVRHKNNNKLDFNSENLLNYANRDELADFYIKD